MLKVRIINIVMLLGFAHLLNIGLLKLYTKYGPKEPPAPITVAQPMEVEFERHTCRKSGGYRFFVIKKMDLPLAERFIDCASKAAQETKKMVLVTNSGGGFITVADVIKQTIDAFKLKVYLYNYKYCASACFDIVMHLPKKNILYSPRSKFMFHQAWSYSYAPDLPTYNTSMILNYLRWMHPSYNNKSIIATYTVIRENIKKKGNDWEIWHSNADLVNKGILKAIIPKPIVMKNIIDLSIVRDLRNYSYKKADDIDKPTR